ncbi:uncharacterized protein LOC142223729 [Haematobia irritans]|uniref:uncharacterized protein LOC142223729 n=1 Tax=Haematobia irritans TaxID=7368 RepID=UPI003F50793C
MNIKFKMEIFFKYNIIALLAIQTSWANPIVTVKQSSMNFIDAEIQYTTSQAERTIILVQKVLNRLPKTQQYEKHQRALELLLRNAYDFKKPGPCHDKMSAFSKTWASVMYGYLQPNTSPEHLDILKLLEEYGLRDMMMEAEVFLRRIVSGKIATPVEVGSPAYYEFLKRQC